MKRGVCILVLLLFTLSSISAAADPAATLGPLTAYETNAIELSLNISNYGNDYEIVSVLLDLDGFVIASLSNYIGWTETSDGSTAAWTDGSLGTNIVLALFELVAAAPMVDSDSTYETAVTLVDADDEEHTFDFNFTILNDNTPPQIHDTVPSDGDFIKEGTQEQIVRANATDPETGVQTAEFDWILCEGNETRHAQLIPEEGLYQAGIDLSEYEDGQQLCFDFTAYNNGGESATYSGTLTVDGIPPVVSLLSPDDGAIIGLADPFSFQAEDNLAATLTCSMYIDGTEYSTDIEAENMQAVHIESADVEEGQHTWSIACADPAGWEGQSATQTYTLDKTPPTIVMTAPENNSIIADSTLLEFEVTDDNQIYSVWIVKDGNETEVTGVFNIDISSWQEGPSEFAVRAEDSVGNQAEQTYRIIIDRSSPNVYLTSPEDNATSDVHVEFVYSVLDNYDEEIDCSIYVDEEGLEEHVATAGSNTSQTELLAIGEHRWKVQCVDDAGNTASSDERRVNVIDTSGPDIQMDNTETVYRGDPVRLSLEVTDISGVEDVSAELRDPDDNIQAVPLENEAGDIYTANIPTTIDTTLGTYILTVYAVDTLNNSNNAEDEILVTYRYVVALEVPPSVAPGEQVSAVGVIMYDDGSMVPEDVLVLELPDESSVNVSIDENGGFTHTFSAPSTAGTYTVEASVLSAGNGETYTNTAEFNVVSPVQPSSGGHGGTGGSNSRTTIADDDESGNCEAEWKCTAWTMCEGAEQKRVCIDMSGCSDETARRTETRSCKPQQEEEDDDDRTGEGNTINAARQPLPGPEEHQVDATQEDPRASAGIGKASGFMSDLDIDFTNILFALLLMTVIMGTLYKYGWAKGDGRKRKVAVDYLSTKGDKLGLEDYINSRANRRYKI